MEFLARLVTFLPGPPRTGCILCVQSLARPNPQVSAGFGRFMANNRRPETAEAEFSRPIRPTVSVGGIRGQFFAAGARALRRGRSGGEVQEAAQAPN